MLYRIAERDRRDERDRREVEVLGTSNPELGITLFSHVSRVTV